MNRVLFPYQWNIAKLTENGLSYDLCKGSKEIRVALIDSGVDYFHPALKDNIDYVNSRNFLRSSENFIDNDGHGTMVAGMICSNGELLGVATNLSLIVCKISEGKHFQIKYLVDSLQYAIENDVDVINLSLSAFLEPNLYQEIRPTINQLIKEAKRKNIVIVTSAGNSNKNIKSLEIEHIPGYHPDVVVVGATNRLGTLASYSNYGNIDYVAPGGEWFNNSDDTQVILTTYPTHLNDMDPISNNMGLPKGYTISYGTSLACAQISGAISVIISKYHQLFNHKPDINIVKKYLNTGIINKPTFEKNLGNGEINIFNSLKNIENDYLNNKIDGI